MSEGRDNFFSNVCSTEGSQRMNTEAILALARHMPISDLAAAWDLSPAMVQTRLTGKRTLCVREVAVLAELYDMTLADILAL